MVEDTSRRTVSIYQIASLFTRAYNKTATVGIALSGFKATGISPLNPNIFPDHLYLPSAATDIREDDTINDQQSTSEEQLLTTSINGKRNQESDVSALLNEWAPIPVASTSSSSLLRRRKKNRYQSVLTEMVSNYKRKSNRQSWSSEDMLKAIEAVKDNRMGWKKASVMFNVPQVTLRRRAQEKNTHARGAIKSLGRFKTSLSGDLEQRLVTHILDLESRLHPNISLRVPEATSAARAQSFNRPQVQKYFAKLEETIQIYNIQATMIYNMDETKITTVQKTQKVIAKKGKKQVGAITSAERSIHTTGVVCMSSSGSFIPPVLIFPRKKLNQALYDGAPIGTLPLYNESAYMTGDLFFKWIKHFVKFARPTAENKALLILDGHATHKTLEALEFAKKNHVILFCLPAHCTHRLQPLDVAFFGPLTTYYDQEVTAWLKTHPGRTVSIYQIASLFTRAYNKTATVGIALSGFKATGISPLNPNIFPDHLYLPSAATDIREDDTINDQQSTSEEQLLTTSINGKRNQESDVSALLNEWAPIPVASTSSSSLLRRRKKNRYQSVLTESQFLNELKAKEAAKKENQQRKRKRTTAKRRIHVDFPDNEPTIDNDDSDSAVGCLYCNELFSQSRQQEQWIQCQQCHQWAHAECAGVSKSIKQFACAKTNVD
ncbi:hypothetical protein MML48_3g00002243 [Holotrichia oblita]|uniref:Uncharacterized protein n=1 Tax=Holotrichia oblita TaxID=644536 RepID=A0ACB9TEI1_HOLOL|nr:hypothetical protein MML48_3g00002243 [Holotrichia oblita]